MKHLIEFVLKDGISVFVEVNEAETTGGIVRAAITDELPQKAAITFEQAIDEIKPLAEVIISRLRTIVDPSDEMQVEFGLKMAAETGVVIAAGSVEANFNVTLTWKNSTK